MSALLGPEKKHPTEWETELGFRILDPDGWRNRGLDFHHLITADAFMVMAMESTIEIRNRQRLIDSGVIELPMQGAHNDGPEPLRGGADDVPLRPVESAEPPA